jgi:hypothetical protein
MKNGGEEPHGTAPLKQLQADTSMSTMRVQCSFTTKFVFSGVCGDSKG